MKITTTAGTLKSGDKIGKRVVRYSTFREYNLGHHVYFKGSDTPEPYGRNEPITVELANSVGWYIRNRKTKMFWFMDDNLCSNGFYSNARHAPFSDEDEATSLVSRGIKAGKIGDYDVEVVFLS